MTALIWEQYRMESLSSIPKSQLPSINPEINQGKSKNKSAKSKNLEQDAKALSSGYHTELSSNPDTEFGYRAHVSAGGNAPNASTEQQKSSLASSYTVNAANRLIPADQRSEICVSPSWETDKARRERKKELKRLEKEKRELEKSLKLEAKRNEDSKKPARRLTKKQPLKPPSRASSIKSGSLKRSSTAPSLLGFRYTSRDGSKASSINEPGSSHSTPEAAVTIEDNDGDGLELAMPRITGLWPQRFGVRITQDFANDKDPVDDLESSPSIPASPLNIPERHLHASKKNADLRGAAKSYQQSDEASSQYSYVTSTKSAQSQEIDRRLSLNSTTGKKLQRKSARIDHELPAHSLRRRTNKVPLPEANATKKGDKRSPPTISSSRFPAVSESPSPPPLEVRQPDEDVPPSANNNTQSDGKATGQDAEEGMKSTYKGEKFPVILEDPAPSPSQLRIGGPGDIKGKYRKRRQSWSEIFSSSEHLSVASLRRLGQKSEPGQKKTDRDTAKQPLLSEPGEHTNGTHNQDQVKVDPSVKSNGRIDTQDTSVTSDNGRARSKTTTELVQPTSITDSPYMERASTAPSPHNRPNPMQLPPKYHNRDVPFRSSPLAAPPLNTQEDDETVGADTVSSKKTRTPSVMSSTIPASQESSHPVDTATSKNEKSSFSLMRLLRYGSKRANKHAMVERAAKPNLEPIDPEKLMSPVIISALPYVDKKEEKDEPVTTGSKQEVPKPSPTSDSNEKTPASPEANSTGDGFEIPPKSPKRNSGVYSTYLPRPNSASAAEILSAADGRDTTGSKKQRSISVDIPQEQVSRETSGEKRRPSTSPQDSSQPKSSRTPPSISPSFPPKPVQTTGSTSSALVTKDATKKSTNAADSLSLWTVDRNQSPSQVLPANIADPRPLSSSRQSISAIASGRAQRPMRRGTPVAKMFVICCQCRYWHDMPSDVYAKLAFPNGQPPGMWPETSPPENHSQLALVNDEATYDNGQQPQTGASGALVLHGAAGEVGRPATSNGLDSGKSAWNSRPSSSSSSSSSNFTVTCCWCAHRMVRTCCAGWTTVVYLHERHH
ncbi:hypothetical protein FQN50_007596 [Emmonsiellopsis sp. PD_5]|nr:hypothetical protein FQN50_007596 [Emmonsiellopsis sp. PD_5]